MGLVHPSAPCPPMQMTVASQYVVKEEEEETSCKYSSNRLVILPRLSGNPPLMAISRARDRCLLRWHGLGDEKGDGLGNGQEVSRDYSRATAVTRPPKK